MRTRGLRPWRELVAPHPDVASGRHRQAEFAADLHQVWRGEAAPEYGDPGAFFQRTFLTAGLGALLRNAERRWRREGGDPVVELRTSFGGGKTHAMIALFHLAAGHPPEPPADPGTIAAPAATTAVLAGQMLPPGRVTGKPDGTRVHTLWGELAWQLGGAEGYRLVADADRSGTSPGAALVDLLRRHAPCLILVDEWVAYARQLYGVDGLPAGSFDAQFTFAQALAEATRAVDGALLVVSVPAADAEAGGEGGRASLQRLRQVIGRLESSWRPASAEDGFEIVRRRLFEDLPAGHAAHRDDVVAAFARLYRGHRAEFPRGCSEADYQRRLTAAYPIHPELFDRLYGDWSRLDRFQGTRGVLRLMAAVVHELWERDDASLLVMPATIPVDAPAVSWELTRYLEDGWTPVVARDVDGPNALPPRLDRDNPSLGRYAATRRVARTIYLGSAAAWPAADRGLDLRSVKLGCAQPGEAPATFGDALRRLTDEATYLYVDGQRCWYSPRPSVTRLAHDRAASHVGDDDVDEEIRRRLALTQRHHGDFAAVHAAPHGPGDVPDDPAVRLVVLGPEYPHAGRSADSPARAAARRFLDKRATGDRLHRNMLVFLAADRSRLQELRHAVRQQLAWASIEAEKDTLDLDNLQRRQASTRREQLDAAVGQRIGETYAWVLTPGQAVDEPTVTWEETRVDGTGPLAVRAADKLAGEEGLITGYSGVRLRMDLDRVPLWRGDHVSVTQLWSDYARYLYLPRLRDATVLLGAVRDGVAQPTWQQDTFAYAGAVDEPGGRYAGLVAGVRPRVTLDGAGVVVKPEAARRQLDADGRGIQGTGRPHQPDRAPEPAPPARFRGRRTLQPARLLRDVGDVADAIVGQLARAPDAEVIITVEIDATAGGGFDDDIRRTVTENARTLEFDTHEFESE
jgi:uncharacterized protein